MRIAFTGVQCTGKTTLIDALMKDPAFESFTVIKESIRSLKDKGYHINEDGNDDTQIAVMNAHIMNLIPTDTLIDRCAIDGLCYGEYSFNHGKISIDTLNFCRVVWELTRDYYDFIFYIRPEFDLIEDGTRSVNKEFRDEVLKIFDKYITETYNRNVNHYGMYNNNIYMISGTVEQRVHQVKQALIDKKLRLTGEI